MDVAITFIRRLDYNVATSMSCLLYPYYVLTASSSLHVRLFKHVRGHIHEDHECRSKAVLLLWIFYVFSCLVFGMPLCATVYICPVVTCWERADPLALVCGV